jgi:hypothetical protein
MIEQTEDIIRSSGDDLSNEQLLAVATQIAT